MSKFNNHMHIFVWLMICLHSFKGKTQDIINGSFEFTSKSCGLNLTNESINTIISDFHAFGPKSEIDLLSDSCGYLDPIDGKKYLAINNNDFTDAFSMRLSKNTIPNKIYKLSFYARIGDNIKNSNSFIAVGITDNRNQFGVEVSKSDVITNQWKKYEVQWTCQEITNWISIKLLSLDDTWVFVDHFVLECPTFSLGNDTIVCESSNILLQVDKNLGQFTWNTGESTNVIIPQSPGMYSITTTDGLCIYSDTIFIEEYEQKCNCKLFYPNIFSPNDDLNNDEFKISTNCTFKHCKLIIYDRWGNQIFTSIDHNLLWDGKDSQGKNCAKGIYTFLLVAEFMNPQNPIIKGDQFTLVN